MSAQDVAVIASELQHVLLHEELIVELLILGLGTMARFCQPQDEAIEFVGETIRAIQSPVAAEGLASARGPEREVRVSEAFPCEVPKAMRL